jgi:hypothetical protein
VELVVFPVGILALLVAEQQFNLPVAAAALAVKTDPETVLRVDLAVAAGREQQAVALRHRVDKAVLAAVLHLALFPAAAAELVRLERQERSPLLVVVEMATLIR